MHQCRMTGSLRLQVLAAPVLDSRPAVTRAARFLAERAEAPLPNPSPNCLTSCLFEAMPGWDGVGREIVSLWNWRCSDWLQPRRPRRGGAKPLCSLLANPPSTNQQQARGLTRPSTDHDKSIACQYPRSPRLSQGLETACHDSNRENRNGEPHRYLEHSYSFGS